jgi:hypothetical protein
MSVDIKIQLVKENGKGIEGILTLTDDSNFPYNLSISDIKQPDSKKSGYSKTIKINGSKENNLLLKQIYDINLGVNLVQKQRCLVLIDGDVFLDNVYFQVITIKKEKRTSNIDDTIIYECCIVAAESNFFTSIKDKFLDDIDFSSSMIYDTTTDEPLQNKPFDSDLIKDSFTNTHLNGYKFLLPKNNALGEISISSVKPAYYAFKYFDAIVKNAGYSYTFDEIGIVNGTEISSRDDLRFKKLLIPYLQKNDNTDVMTNSAYKVSADMDDVKNIPSNPIKDGYFAIQSSLTQVLNNFNDNISDPSSSFDGHFYTSPFSGTVIFNLNANVSATFNNGHTDNIKGVGMGSKITPSFRFAVYKNGVIAGYSSDIKFNDIVNLQTFSPGNTSLGTISGNVTASVQVIAGDVLEVKPVLVSGQTSSSNYEFVIDITGTPLATIANIYSVVNSGHLEITNIIPNGNLMYGNVFNSNNYIPINIKQSDFIKSLLTMFNIYVFVDPDKPYLLQFQTRDYYYDNGDKLNLTEYLVKDNEVSIEYLSNSQNKMSLISYKNDDNPLNKEYADKYQDSYGSARFVFDNENIVGENKIEIIFSPAPITYEDTRYSVNLEVKSLLILYDGGQDTCNSYTLRDTTTISQNLTVYPVATHLNAPKNPSFDLNFGNTYEIYYDGVTTTNNLLNNFWRRTYYQINSGKLVTLYLALPVNIFKTIKLNSSIYIEDSWYIINQIIDYNPAKSIIVKLELLTIDKEYNTSVSLPVIDTGSTKPIFGGTLPQTGIINAGNDPSNGNIVGSGNTGAGTVIGIGNNTTRPIGGIIGNGNVSSGFGSNIIGDHNVSVGNGANIVGSNNTTFGSGVILGNNNIGSEYAKEVFIMGSNNNVADNHTFVVGDNITPTQAGIWADYSNISKIETIEITTSDIITDTFTATTVLVDDIDTTDIICETVTSDEVTTDLINSVDIVNSNNITTDNIDVTTINGQPYPPSGANVVSKTLSQLNTLINSASLEPNTYYFINDEDIYAYAIDNSHLTEDFLYKVRVVKETTYLLLPNHFGCLTINYAYNVGDIVVWGARAWTCNTATTLISLPASSTDPGSNFTLIPQSNNTYYEDKLFRCDYNIYQNKITYIYDNNGNKLGDGVDAKAHRYDFNFINTYNNNVTYILNNNLTHFTGYFYIAGNISDNTCAYITNNSNNGNISDNSNNGAISDNSNDGDITNNSNDGNISDNSNIGAISDNSNNGAISDNSNDVDITNNSNNGNISYNSNNGAISDNSNIGYIYGNSNNGNISYNSNNGYISSNSNNGYISSNSNNSFISSNSNNGYISRNSNLSDISYNSGTSINNNIYTNRNTLFIRYNNFITNGVNIEYNINNGFIGHSSTPVNRTTTITDAIVNK